jgi:UDP-glucose 4-epimerase
MTALVTGGAGFIGSNLVDELLKSGHKVVCVDNESAESNDQFYWNDDAHSWKVSVTDYDALLDVCTKYKPKWIFHLAAESRIQPTIERPQDACNTNIIGTCNVLQAARECGARVMYSSTSAAYGLKNESPLKECMPTDCLNPYSVTKVAGEALCKMYYKLFGVETIIFRYFNVYGPRQPVKGQYAPVIGLFMRQKDEGKKMTVTGDGQQRRDYTHVSDVVSANILASTTQNKKALGSIFNIGTGTNHSVLDLVKLLGGQYEFISARCGEARETLADNTRARTILGWEPKMTLEHEI